MQWSVRINEAYQRLRDPLKRAAYLCELRGAPVNAENNTAMPAVFLTQQGMASRSAALQSCAALLDDQGDATGAVQQVRALMFIERFSADVQVRQDRLDLAERGQ